MRSLKCTQTPDMTDAGFILYAGTLLMSTVLSLPASIKDSEITSNNIPMQELTIVSREEWGARTPKGTNLLNTPLPYVIIHHTYIPAACTTTDKCKEAMRSMQDYHMDIQGWNDIGYNFCVGGDNLVYAGRGWTTLGAHAAGSNSVSIGICIIGDWTKELPPKEQLEITKTLIEVGVSLGQINPEYILLGHRQVRNTECPGDALFKEISSWNHFSVHPTSPREALSLARINDTSVIKAGYARD